MLTSFYYPIRILKSLFSGFSTSLPGRGNFRSLLMGLLGRMAGQEDIAITEIANLFGVSRQAVYVNIDRVEAIEAQIQALPDVPFNCLMVTPKDIDKAILSLALDAHASLEGIQRVLTCIYGEKGYRCIGYISMLLNRAGAFAAEITRTIPLQSVTQAANDELFDANDAPVLTGVDAVATYIYLIQPMNDRKGETWHLVMEELKDLGLKLKVAISDAGNGLLKGVKAAFPDADIQIDVFHLLRDMGRSVYHFKEHVLKKVTECYELEKSVSRSKSPWRQKTKDKKKRLAKYTAELPTLMEDHDTLSCLYSWVHELVSFSGYEYKDVMELMGWLLDEMMSVVRRNSWAYKLGDEISRFKERLPATMLFLNRLFRDFNRSAKLMGLPEDAFRLLYRRLGVPKGSDAYIKLTRQVLDIIGPHRLDSAQKAHDRIVSCIKRASSMVENVNSRLRAYMNIKKHVSSNFYSLIQLYLNTKKYRRSRVDSRKGHSPVELLTGKPWPDFIDLLEERGFWAKCTDVKIA